jgi:hypothetical protein
MSSPIGTIIAHPGSPPWLPRDVAEGRKFAWWGQMMFLLMALVWFIIAIASIVLFFADRGNIVVGIFGMFAMVICGVAGLFVKRTVIDAIDQGRFNDAKNDSIVWIVFGLVGFVIPSLFLILTYAKISDTLAAQQPVGYQPYAPGQVSAQMPPPYVPPPGAPQPPPPAPVQPAQTQGAPGQQPYHGHQTPMIRCKNCNVQYPMFMHSCPNCGAPKE